MIHQSVAAAWHDYNKDLEGVVLTMYQDIKGYVTTGVGLLIDSVAAAQKMEWRHRESKAPATPNEVAEEWHRVKDLPKALHWRQYAKVCELEMANMDGEVNKRLHEFAEYLEEQYFGEWPSWPADAQLASLSMAWAVGPGFPTIFKNWRSYAEKQDWVGCGASCKIKTDGNPGVIPRNAQNKLCFSNAALVAKFGLPRHELFWPSALSAPELQHANSTPTDPFDEPTKPDNQKPSHADIERTQRVTFTGMLDDYLDQSPGEIRRPDGEEGDAKS